MRLPAVIAGSLFPGFASAQEIDVCPLPFLSCESELGSYIESTLVSGSGGIVNAFYGILFAMLVAYGIKLAISANDENAVQEAKTAYVYAFVGTMIVGVAYALASAFSEGIPSFGVVDNLIATAAGAVGALVGVLLTAQFIIQGVKMITAQDEGGTSSARALLIQGSVGAGIVILSSVLVTGSFTGSAVGVASFIATIFGVLCVVGIVAAGIMLVTSVDEGQKDRAKSLIIACLATLAVVISAFVLVRTFAIFS